MKQMNTQLQLSEAFGNRRGSIRKEPFQERRPRGECSTDGVCIVLLIVGNVNKAKMPEFKTTSLLELLLVL